MWWPPSGQVKASTCNQLTPCDAAQGGSEWIIKIPSTHTLMHAPISDVLLNYSETALQRWCLFSYPLEHTWHQHYGTMLGFFKLLLSQSSRFYVQKNDCTTIPEACLKWSALSRWTASCILMKHKKTSIVCHSLSPHLHNKSSFTQDLKPHSGRSMPSFQPAPHG